LLDDLTKTSTLTRESVETLTKELSTIAASTDKQIARFIETATATTENAGEMLAGQSEFRHELNQTLEELNSALRAIRLFAEYMEQHPEALIRGKAD
jgi:paraquat-inducible protein B